MEVDRLRVLLMQLLEYPTIVLESLGYEESLKVEMRQKYFELRQCSLILMDLLSLKFNDEEDRNGGGLILSGSLEDVLRNKKEFLENSAMHVKSEMSESFQSTERSVDIDDNDNNDDIGDNDDIWDSQEDLDVKVKLEEIEVEVKQNRKTKIHFCESCNFQATNGKTLRKHVTLMHGRKEKPYKKCRFCMEEFQMREDQTMNSRYRNHLEKFHSTQDLSEFKEEFDKMDCLTCSVCGKSVYGSNPNMAQSNLNRHMKDKHENGVGEKVLVSCPQCEKTVNPKYLKKHIELTHNDAKFTCDQCGKSCKNKQQMRLHIKEHSSDPADSFQCELCHEIIPASGSLRLHMYLKHGGRKFNPVTCDECGKQLSDKSKLQKHKDSVHLNKKPYKCDLCDLSVSRIDNLKQHKVRVHKIGFL